MPSVNKVFILGALGRDPETRFTSTNLQITSFSVALHSVRERTEKERTEKERRKQSGTELQLSVALLRLLKHI